MKVEREILESLNFAARYDPFSACEADCDECGGFGRYIAMSPAVAEQLGNPTSVAGRKVVVSEFAPPGQAFDVMCGKRLSLDVINGKDSV